MLASLMKLKRPDRPARKREYRVPTGLRVYAIGDIHGHVGLLDDVLRLIDADQEVHPEARPILVFLGDYIDRGPNSKQVLDRLVAIRCDSAVEAYFILGNHEEAFLRILAGETDLFADWLRFGGLACLESYGVEPDDPNLAPSQFSSEWLRELVPASHRDFLEACDDSVSIGDYIFVHAGIRPGAPLDGQMQRDLRWIRAPFLTSTVDHGAVVVHGHTISDEIDWQDNRIGIDTGAYRTGVLTALILAGSRRRSLQTGKADA